MSVARNTTILLAEDDPNDVLLIQRVFRKANLVNCLEVVKDGEQLVAYLSAKGPYADRNRYPLPVLLLLDLKLPRKSGLEVLAWVRQQPTLMHLPVVMLTSSSVRSDINRAHELGANFYLVKPAAFENLLDMAKALGLYWILLSKPGLSTNTSL